MYTEANLKGMTFVPSTHMPSSPDTALNLAAMYENMGNQVLDAAASDAPEVQAQAITTATRLHTRAEQLLTGAVRQEVTRQARNR